MANEFYDPLIWTAGKIAEEYGVAVSDVLGLLLYAHKDEDRVRRVLEASKQSEQAKAAERAGRPFDIVERAREMIDRPDQEDS